MLQRFLQELRRRRVPQVAGVYLAVAWLLFEVSESVLPRLGLEDWTVTLILWLLILGFPLAVGLAWAFDVTPEGVRRTPDRGVGKTEPGSPREVAPEAGAEGHFNRIAVAGAIAVLAAAGAAFLFLGRDGPVEVRRDEVAVFPFSVLGGEDVEVLGEGMVSLLGTKLDGAGGLRATDAGTVLRLAGEVSDPATADALAARLGAAHYVRGSILEYGGNVRLQAAIYQRGQAEDPLAEAAVEGPAESFLTLVDDLAAQLITASELTAPGRMPRAAALTTERLSALKAFLEGERAFRDTRYDTAILRLQRAVEIDTAFALAHYRLSVAAWWDERHGLAGRALQDAQRHADRLSERDRMLMEALSAARSGRHRAAERRYRRIVEAYPDDLEAWYELGEVIFHSGYLLGLALADAREAFSNIVDVDPGHGAALYHLSNIAAVQGELELLDSLMAIARNRAETRDPTLEAQWAFAVEDSAGMARALEAIATGQAPFAASVFAMWAADDLHGVQRIVAAIRERVPPQTLPAAMPWVAGELVRFGQRDEALAEIERAEGGSLDPNPLRAALFASYPFLRTPPEKLRQLRERLRAWDAGPVLREPVPSDAANPHAAMQPHVRTYLLALVEARLGRREISLRLADELESLGGLEAVRQLSADLARHIRAQVALDEGRPEAALSIIEPASFWNELQWDQRRSGVFAHQGSVLLRAEALHALGRYRDALRWYRAAASWARVRAYSHYRSGEAYEALGFPHRAGVHYHTFTRLWADADPELQPMVTHAKDRLGALTEEAPGTAPSEPLLPYW